MTRSAHHAAAILASTAALSTSSPAADPKFQRQVIDDDISIGYGLAVGDVDGDGKPDVLLADQSQIVWYRNGDWQRFVMAENLNPRVGTRFRDNVCIAARDIDGDGKVEVAVGGQWNPGETTDASKSGSVHYLVRPDDPTARWNPVQLHHEPTVHRMLWVKTGDGEYQLVVLPLHGRGNKDAEGAGVKVLAYHVPEDPADPSAWRTSLIDDTMHATHNLDVIAEGDREGIAIAGKEGCKMFLAQDGKWLPRGHANAIPGGLGEVRQGENLVGISPMHGNAVVIITGLESPPRSIDDSLSQGHALALGDLLGLGEGREQIVAGWRSPNRDGRVGIKLYVPQTAAPDPDYRTHLIDDNGIACEDLKLADLDGDGKLDIVAAGRATQNVVIYWNKNEN